MSFRVKPLSGGLHSTGVGSVTSEPRALLVHLCISWNPTTIPKAGHRPARTQILSQTNSTGLEEVKQPLEMEEASLYLDPGLGSRDSEDAFSAQPSFFQAGQQLSEEENVTQASHCWQAGRAGYVCLS